MDGATVKVFVVWEPVLATDFTAPSTATLARVSDLRAAQFWDHERLLSHLLGEHDRSTVVWDYIAVFAPGTTWKDTPPTPIYSDRPVVRATGGANDAIQRLLTASSQSEQKN